MANEVYNEVYNEVTKGQDSAATGAGDELIARLEAPVPQGTPLSVCRLLDEAAAALAAARQENERLHEHLEERAQIWKRLWDEHAALRQRETELRAALEDCVHYIVSPLRMSDDRAEAKRRQGIVNRAQSLLSPTPKEPSHDDCA